MLKSQNKSTESFTKKIDSFWGIERTATTHRTVLDRVPNLNLLADNSDRTNKNLVQKLTLIY